MYETGLLTDRYRPLRLRSDLKVDKEIAALSGIKPPPIGEYMPDFGKETLGFCLYETSSCGTPLSPVFLTTPALLEWCVENQVCLIGGHCGSREEWQYLLQYLEAKEDFDAEGDKNNKNNRDRND
jgi:hypothetical protein